MALWLTLVRKVRRSACPHARPRVELLEARTLPSFIDAGSYTVGKTPMAIGVADFNGDGTDDLAVVNIGADTVSVLLGNGDGTFQPKHDYAVGDRPSAVAVGDFNGDGIPDLAVANSNSLYVSILLGNGDGTFQAKKDYAAFGPAGVAVGDFNGDGILDLALACASNNTVAVLLGNGDGSFQSPVYNNVGPIPFAVAAGDFTGDGTLDLAVTNSKSSTVSVLLGNGDGSFQDPVTYVVAANPLSVAVGDFTGTGMVDLAVTNQGTFAQNYADSSVSVLLGNGDGSFQQATNYDAGTFLYAVTVADFNLDGIPDLAVTSSSRENILLGNGDGTFQAPQATLAPYASFAAVGDFNGDGYPDLAATDDVNAGQVTILLNAADWDTGPTVSHSASAHPLALDPLVAAPGAPESLTVPPSGSTATDATLTWTASRPAGTVEDPATPAEAKGQPVPAIWNGHAPQALSGGWYDPLADALALTWK
jgi:hypothetical protein